MCQSEDNTLRRESIAYVYYDENTGEPLNPDQVHAGEQDEMSRFPKMGVYDYTSRQTAENDPDGKFVRVKWVRVNKGHKIRCRLVAQNSATEND